MADFTFDGPNKLIIEPVGSGNTAFDVDRDIYSAWKRWVQTGSGAQFLNAFAVEGGTPIGATGFFTGSTFILVNGWKIRGADHDHQLFLNGNLYSDDGVVSSPNPSNSVEVFVNASVAAQGVSAGSGLDATQAAQLIEIWKRLDLDSAAPNTHHKDSSRITNGSDIDLVSTDNEDGTFTVQRQ